MKITRAERRDDRRRKALAGRSTGHAASAYMGGPDRLHRKKIASSIYRIESRRIKRGGSR